MKLLLKNVVLDGKEQSISIENGMISAIAPALPQDNTEIFDAHGKLAVLPPFYNAHNHAAMTLLRGYAEDMELFDWLSNHIWPVEAKLTAEDIYIGTKLAIMEMIRSGTVYFNDSYWHPEAALKAVQETGIRATLGLLYLGDISDDAKSANAALIEAAKDVDTVTVSHTPHAIYTVDKPTLQKIAEMMKSDGRKVHIHVSETAKEVADCLKEHGVTPVEYLDSLGLINDRAMLAHCVHLTDHDREIISDRGAYIAHNPVSNMKLCSGMFNFEAARKAGCKVAIGTDGTSSNNNLSMIDEMKVAALTAKMTASIPTAGRTADIFHAATAIGAEFAGVKAGKIAPGYAADMLLVKLDHPVMSANYDLIADMVYAASPEVIDSVICNGKFLMKNNVIPEEAETVAAAKEVCQKIASWQ
ncbi:MAG: amidohydrolase [Lentisphaerae bacterium]|nr:amidohydrolase [Lentisphaerota bacterium]